MLLFLESLGTTIKVAILHLAANLAGEYMPGLVALGLGISAVVLGLCAVIILTRRKRAIRRFRKRLPRDDKATNFLHARDQITAWSKAPRRGAADRNLAQAWQEFDETLVLDETQDPPALRNSVRPGAFFNIDDLHFGPGFFRVVPGLFVSLGLALTFLGLIAALDSMGQGSITDATMANLLKIASAKFIMSLTGLLCSILFTIILRVLLGRLDAELHHFCARLEECLTFVSLEQVGLEQLRVMREAQEHNRSLTAQLIAEIGHPLRTELPVAISTSISSAMQPLLDRVGRQGSESMSTMASDLSQQISSGVGSALTAASETLAQAGERIGQLADRMDQSSGRMGSEMEQAVARVALAVDELRTAMAANAESTSGVFSAGAEQMLAAMNRTLEGIRDNTSEGARAMSAAATDMRDAAGTMRAEMEGAVRSGSEAARLQMQQAGDRAGAAIDAAGQGLAAPLVAVAEQMQTVAGTISRSTADLGRSADAVRDGAKAGAEAAVAFRGASQELVAAATPVRATSERIEATMREFVNGSRDALQGVVQAARTTADSAAQTLETAGKTLATERAGVEAALAAVTEMLSRLRGQGDQMDSIDEKLGRAFDIYTTQTESAMNSIREHVQKMSHGLNIAVSQLDAAIQSMQDFTPQQTRH